MARNTSPPERDPPDSGGQQSPERRYDPLKVNLAAEIERMIEQERLMFTRWATYYSIEEIALEVQLTVLDSLSRTIEESPGGGAKIQRLDAFRALRARLQLSSEAARQWQKVINDARR